MSGQQMYDLIPIICGVFFIIYGLVMIISPKTMVKKAYKNDADMIAKTKKNGIFVMIGGILVIAVRFI